MLCFNYTVGFPLSVPVLSQLFIAKGIPACRQTPGGGPPLRELQQARRGRVLPERAPLTQPSEPILIANLRIHFADFPYLHCSID